VRSGTLSPSRARVMAGDRRDPADAAARRIDLVDTDDGDLLLTAGAVEVVHGGAEEDLIVGGRVAGSTTRASSRLSGSDPAVDLAQPLLA